MKVPTDKLVRWIRTKYGEHDAKKLTRALRKKPGQKCLGKNGEEIIKPLPLLDLALGPNRHHGAVFAGHRHSAR